MDAAKQIQIAVAKADLIICTVLRYLPVIVPLCIILLAVIAYRRRAGLDDRTDSWQDWR